jgi:hypothetical protein
MKPTKTPDTINSDISSQLMPNRIRPQIYGNWIIQCQIFYWFRVLKFRSWVNELRRYQGIRDMGLIVIPMYLNEKGDNLKLSPFTSKIECLLY